MATASILNRIASATVEKEDLLARPDEVDKLVAREVDFLLPTTKTPKYSKAPDRTTALDETIPEDHPLKGYVPAVRQKVEQALAMPEFRQFKAKDIANVIVKAEIAQPGKSGRSKLEEAYRYKREADASTLFGENKQLKKLPGHEEYLQDVKAEEDKRLAEESYLASPADILTAGGLGAAVGAVTGGPGGAVSLGVLSAATEVLSHPVRKLLHQTEWYRAKEASDSLLDKAKLLGADFIPDVVGGAVLQKSFPKVLQKAAEAGILKEEAASIFNRFPTAANAVKMGSAIKAEKDFNNLIDNAVKEGVDYKGIVFDQTKRFQEAGGGYFDEAAGRMVVDPYFVEAAKATKRTTPLQSALQFEENVLLRRAQGTKVAATQAVETQGNLLRNTFKELSDEAAEDALRKAEAGIRIEDATREASLASKAIRETTEKQQKLFGFESTSSQEEIARQYQSVSARRTQELDASMTKKQALWERENASKVRELQANTALRERYSSQLSNYGVEGTKIPTQALEKQKGLTSVKRMKGLVSEEQAKTMGWGGVKEAEDDLNAFYNILDEEAITAVKANVKKIPKGAGIVSGEGKGLSASQLTDDMVFSSKTLGELKEGIASEAAWVEKEINEFFSERVALEGAEKGIEAFQDILNPGKIIGRIFGEKVKAGASVLEAKAQLTKANASYSSIFNKILSRRSALILLAPTLISGSIALDSLFGVKEAEAGVFSQAAKTIPKVLVPQVEGLAKKVGLEKAAEIINKLHLDSVPVDPLNPYVLPRMQEGLRVGKGASAAFGHLTKAVERTTGLPMKTDRLLTPYARGVVFYKEGANPAVEIASVQTAYLNNSEKAIQVAKNILDVAGIGTDAKVTKVISDTMEPLAKRYGPDVALRRAVEAQHGVDTKALTGLRRYVSKYPEKAGKISDKITELEERLGVATKIMDDLKPQHEAYLKEWEETVKGLADKYSTVRVALASEDTAWNTYYPWLKGKLSFTERSAISRIQKLMGDYAVRSKEAGLHPLTERPYMHHAWHPAWNEESVALRMKELSLSATDSTPLTKFFQRGKYSRMMLPDTSYILSKYIPDAERRIQWSSFWGRGQKDGWYAHMRSSVVQGNPALKAFWDSIKESSIPIQSTTANQWANRYAAFEVARLIGFAPSVAFKHIFKNVGTWSALGLSESLKHAPEAIGAAERNWLYRSANTGLLSSLGVTKAGAQRALTDQYVDSFAHTNRLMSIVADMEVSDLTAGKGIWKSVDSALAKINDKGSVLVGSIEAFDRAHSVIAATEIAMKRGMTGQQAAYGIYDTILKNNFLGGALNPSWLRDPKVRALFLFQSTPFKIWERRAIQAYRTNRALTVAGRNLKGASLGDFVQALKGLKNFIRDGEAGFKGGLITDALNTERDFFGTLVAKQLVKDMVISGALISAGGSLGLDLMPQVGHVPFLNMEATEPSLRVAPIVGGVFETLAKRHQAKLVNEEPDFIVTDFLSNWLGRSGIIPVTINKAIRISEVDIPEIYKDSPLQYLFSVPANKK